MMPRKKPKLNIWQRQYAEWSKPPYNRDAGYVLFGEYDVFPSDASEPTTNPVLAHWIDAMMAFDDKHHDATPLIALLDSDAKALPIVGIWLADLTWRHGILTDGIEDFIAQRRQLACVLRDFKLPPPTVGRPMVPAYDLSDRDAEKYIANDHVTDYLEESGGSVADAIAAIARAKFPHDIEKQSRFENALTLFRKGQHTSARRAAARRRR